MNFKTLGARKPKLERTEQLEHEAFRLGFVKEIVRLDPKKIAPLERAVEKLAERHRTDERFQQNVINYLNLMVQFLEAPVIIDTFGDTPEGHEKRKDTIRTMTSGNDALYRLFESQKISKNQLGIVGIISQNIIPFLYPATTVKGKAYLDALAKEAEPLFAEVEEKLYRGTVTPLAEKLELVHRVEDFIIRSITIIVDAYGQEEKR